MSINPDDLGRIICIRHKGRLYDHYGILDGLGQIIHINKRLGMITSDPLEKALRNAKSVAFLQDTPEARWRNYELASALIGSKHQYSFFTNSCETWVLKIRTGQAFSSQVDTAANTAAATILAGAGLLALCGII